MKCAIQAFSLCAVFSLLLASCADSKSFILVDTSETLRSQSDARDADTLWTRELEAMRLFQNIEERESIEKSIPLTPFTVIAAASNYDAVYPFLSGFGSLDTSLISQELRAVLDTFVQAILSGQSADRCMARGSLYSYVFFMNDMQAGWKQFFGSDMPEYSESHPLFSTVLYGAPFIDEQGAVIPVRLGFSRGSIDVLLCFENAEDGYKINQIEIQKWSRAHGK
ncbi:MAG: hypothetical protein J6I73_05530 [Treponema sp.]|nr:hypothetical protein [Treponema sp.]